jgi:hypothetical protein
MRYIVFFFVLTLHTSQLFSQDKKTLIATRITTSPKIDGILDDTIWQNIPANGDFYMFEPSNDGLAPSERKTEVKMAYNNKAVYIAAYLYDSKPDEIASQFSQRDEVFVQADVFTVALNTYNDGINETRFIVTSAGTIGDSRVSQNDQDRSYDVVFQCRISKDTKGWYAEFEIPYNALRFPEIDVQDWSINFYRRVVNANETYTWNRIDRSTGRETLYNGKVEGVKNITPPTRLTFYPFIQAAVTNFEGNTETNLSAGMDIKYGISDGFTLDATLVPDFGQAAFDNVILNLGPFEQTFRENRLFFTEGVELFNKGEIFFSRRIGNSPTGDIGELNSDEVIIEEPTTVKLLNALKVSGRTENLLGIGVLNTITERTETAIQDTITGQMREVVVEPLANYNVFVLDQQFNGNSSISLTNTNVIREGNFRDANVTALSFDVADKRNNYRASGRGVVSNVNEVSGFKTGLRTELDLERIKGKFRYRVGHDFANKTFDINDLGVNFRNNFNNIFARVSYQIFEPTKTFNRYRFSLSVAHRRLYDPNVVTNNSISFNSFFVTPSRLAFGLDFGYRGKEQDYFEPRVDGKFVTFAQNVRGNFFVSTDFRKKFAFDLRGDYRYFIDDPQRNLAVAFIPRYRFSDQFLVIVSTEYSTRDDNFGYIDDNETDVFFGQRDIANLETTITASFNFDPFKAIDLKFRNFWSTADYSDDVFTILNDDGTRSPFDYDISENDPNRNFNIWNLDLSFRWRFAPGSEASLLYRNQIFNNDEQATIGYIDSLNKLFNRSIQNTISLRVTYFLDYNNLKDIFNKSSG